MSGEARRFRRAYRLQTAGEFRAVFANPLKSNDRYFTVLTKPNEQTHPRLGLVVMKKRFKRAVQRNRLKRLIRESFRQYAAQLKNLDIVVLAKEPAAAVNNKILFQALKFHWERWSR